MCSPRSPVSLCRPRGQPTTADLAAWTPTTSTNTAITCSYATTILANSSAATECCLHRVQSQPVVLLMWGGILAYLDRSGCDFVAGCVSVPVLDPAGHSAAGSRLRGVRDFALRRHAAPTEYTVRPYRPVVIDGRRLGDIDPPARVSVPPLMRGYLRLGAQVCGEPAHDPDFGVGDFPALLDKRHADTRYLRRLRSVGAAAVTADFKAS